MALLKYKIKSVLPALIFMAVALVVSSGLLFLETNNLDLLYIEYGTFYMNRFAINLFFLPFVLLIASIWLGMCLSKEYGISEKENFIASLPYKKVTGFFVSVLPGVVAFVVFGVVLSVAVCISHSLTFEFYSEINMMAADYERIMELDSVGNALFRLWQIIVTMIMVYFLSFFAGVISRNKMVTVFIVVVMCIVPFYVPTAIGNFVKIPFYDEIISYGSIYDVFVYDEWYDGTCISFFNMKEHMMVMGISAIVFAALSYLSCVKINRAGGRIIVNTKLEKICVIVAGILVALLAAMFLSGCSKSEDFLGQVSEEVNPGLEVHNESFKKAGYPEDVNMGEDTIIRVKEALKDTFLEDYIQEEANFLGNWVEQEFYIDSLRYLSDYALEQGRMVTEMPETDRKLYYQDRESFYKRYSWTYENGLIYLEDENGYIMGDRAFLLISTFDEVKEALIENDLEMVYKIFARFDEGFLKALDNPAEANFTTEAFNCYVAVNDTNIFMDGLWVPFYNEAEYLTEFQAVDGFAMAQMVANDKFEGVSLLYAGDDLVNEEYYRGYPKKAIRLDLYGKNEKLQEIKLIYHNSVSSIPEFCVPTIENCLLELGATKEEVAEFVAGIPTEDTTKGALTYDVEAWKEYTIIKIYTK